MLIINSVKEEALSSVLHFIVCHSKPKIYTPRMESVEGDILAKKKPSIPNQCNEEFEQWNAH